MKSKLFSLSGYDVIKGAVTAALTSGLTALSQQLDIGHIPTWAEGRIILIAGVAAFIGYMLKNFISNSDGKIAAGENKPK